MACMVGGCKGDLSNPCNVTMWPKAHRCSLEVISVGIILSHGTQ